VNQLNKAERQRFHGAGAGIDRQTDNAVATNLVTENSVDQHR